MIDIDNKPGDAMIRQLARFPRNSQTVLSRYLSRTNSFGLIQIPFSSAMLN